MDEPPRGHLRPARPGGLTSPDPGHRAPKAPAATRQTASQHPRQGPVDKPPKRKRQESHTRHHHQDHISGPTRAERHHQNSCGGSRLRSWRCTASANRQGSSSTACSGRMACGDSMGCSGLQYRDAPEPSGIHRSTVPGWTLRKPAYGVRGSGIQRNDRNCAKATRSAPPILATPKLAARAARR